MNNPSAPLDPAKTEAFTDRMLSILNGGMLALMISIGRQTGLFDVMAGLHPSTSEQIASASGLNERYVREWLAAMVVGRIVEYDSVSESYTLPQEHAAFLTTASGPNNMARSAQVIPLLATVESQVIDSFYNGGGVPYSAYTHFMEIVAESSSLRFDKVLISEILPLMPRIVEALKVGINVLDVGCGQGRAINLMAKAFPKSNFTGYDILDEYIEVARTEAKAMRLSNVNFELKNLIQDDESKKYDLITAFDVIHDLAQPLEVLQRVCGILQPEGTLFIADVAGSSYLHENMHHPRGPWMYSVSTMHCMTVSLSSNGAGLGTMWGEQKAKQMLADAGFANVVVQHIPGDVLNVYYIAKKT
ncbi:MAG: class I SAM-dependent methyltransferase [Candidatus Thorarchaeota archaeon]